MEAAYLELCQSHIFSQAALLPWGDGSKHLGKENMTVNMANTSIRRLLLSRRLEVISLNGTRLGRFHPSQLSFSKEEMTKTLCVEVEMVSARII